MRARAQCFFLCITTSLVAQISATWISEYANVTLKRPRTDEPLVEGVDVTLKCLVEGDSEPKITWFRNDIRIFEEDNVSYKIVDSRLKLSSVTSALNGVYTCRGENTAGVAQSHESYLLNVRGQGSAYLKDDLFSKTTVTVRDSDVWIDCLFENYITISWYYKESNTVREITNSTRTTTFQNGTLLIKEVRRSDEGTYICEGMGVDGISQAFTSQLSIAKLGKFTEASNLKSLSHEGGVPEILPAGDKLEVECIRPTGLPTPTLRWVNADGVRILDGSDIYVEGTRLVLDSVDASNSGEYRCVAENMAGTRTIRFKIQVTVPPVISSPPEQTDIGEDSVGTMKCGYTGTPYPYTTVTWLHKDEPIKPVWFETGKMAVNNDTGMLTILHGHVLMEGNYTCKVSTKNQMPVDSAPAFLNIIKKLKFDPKPSSSTFERGTTETIKCQAIAEHTPTITWRVLPEGRKLPNGVVVSRDEITFYEVNKDMEGDYQCVASTGEAMPDQTITATIRIDVGISPNFTVLPENQTVYVGQTTLLDCQANGDPNPTITWDREGKMTLLPSHFEALPNGSLLIQNVKVNDRAFYGCIIGNSRGLKRAEMFLHVIDNTTKNGTNQFSTAKNPEEEVEKEFGIGITKTIVIAVCSAVAYLALVIGLTVWCSMRLMKKRKEAKIEKKNMEKGDNGDDPQETDKLMQQPTPKIEPVMARSTNGFLVTGNHSPRQSPIVIEERTPPIGNVGTPSQRSSRSYGSSSTRAASDIVKYNRNQLKTIGVLGRGMFGDVFLAKAPGLVPGNDEQLVYVKSLLNSDENIQIEFRTEVEMFSKMNHERICRLFALCKEREPIYMVMEYCEWGDLKQFLLATSKDTGQQLAVEPPDNAQKLQMCHQVATAMEYLANCRFVHKDLASRNILLEPSLNVKLAGLSLSRDIYASEYVQSSNGQLLPLRWTSPEAWLEDEYSTKSDVWSYGCFLYEVFSGADIPFCNLTNEQVIAGYKAGNIHPEAGDDMPTQLQTIAYQCWSECAKDRPDFNVIVTMFSGLRADSSL